MENHLFLKTDGFEFSVQIYKPKHLDLEDRNSRLKTFNGTWRTDTEQTPEMLADAGFFYTGNIDICILCVYK